LRRADVDNIYTEFEKENPRKFEDKFRMSVTTFNNLLGLVEPLITKQDTVMRPAISAKVRLQVRVAR
jgi:hypothetical protein